MNQFSSDWAAREHNREMDRLHDTTAAGAALDKIADAGAARRQLHHARIDIVLRNMLPRFEAFEHEEESCLVLTFRQVDHIR